MKTKVLRPLFIIKKPASGLYAHIIPCHAPHPYGEKVRWQKNMDDIGPLVSIDAVQAIEKGGAELADCVLKQVKVGVLSVVAETISRLLAVMTFSTDHSCQYCGSYRQSSYPTLYYGEESGGVASKGVYCARCGRNIWSWRD